MLANCDQLPQNMCTHQNEQQVQSSEKQLRFKLNEKCGNVFEQKQRKIVEKLGGNYMCEELIVIAASVPSSASTQLRAKIKDMLRCLLFQRCSKK